MGSESGQDEDVHLAVQGQEPDLISQLEHLWILGTNRGKLYLWGLDHNLRPEQIDTLIRMIRQMRRTERDPQRFNEWRDEQRSRYLMIFQKAMEKEHLETALRTLDSLSKFDGMIQPDMNLNLVNVNADITNRTRERLSELMGRMRSLGEKKAGVIDVEPESKNRSNGHSNGHNGVVSHPDNPPDDEDGEED